MRPKSYRGRVYGASLSVAETKAMHLEISRQIIKREEQHQADYDALVLYALMIHKGWKKKRLRKFWDEFNVIHAELRRFYEMEADGDNEWLAHYKLREIGVDVKEWYKEAESK